jgi:hypothetical protein
MVEHPNITGPETKTRRWYRFRPPTLLVAEMLLGSLAGGAGWLFVLVGAPAAIRILTALFAASSGFYLAYGLFLLKQQCRTHSNRERARQVQATRVLLELEEHREAIRAAKKDRLRNSDDPPLTGP